MSEMPNTLYDIHQIKQQAEEDLKAGALTEDYPLDINEACKLLNDALATEIMCVLRYRHHQIVATGINYPQVAAEFEEHAKEEEKHMLMIANRINQLGGNPDFNPASVQERTLTEYGNSNDLLTMIKEDLIAERTVIMIYRKLIEWFNTKDPTTRRMLEHILKNEEDHAENLSNLIFSK